MAMAAWGQSQSVVRAEARLSGRLILGSEAAGGSHKSTATYDIEDVKVGRRGLTWPFAMTLAEGRFAWVELRLPSGRTIKPLVAVLGHTDGLVSARIVHCFPEHQRALEAHLATASGY